MLFNNSIQSTDDERERLSRFCRDFSQNGAMEKLLTQLLQTPRTTCATPVLGQRDDANMCLVCYGC